MAEQATQTPPVNNGQQVQLSAEMLAMIHGHVNEEEKHNKLDKSLHSWWTEYAARKNDEEHEMVADSLLYDERCHLPRTTPPPVFRTPHAPPTPPTTD